MTAFVVLLLVIAAVFYVGIGHRARTQELEWLPRSLQDAQLVLVERSLFTAKPEPIACRPDRVYRMGNGLHVPLEFKTRDRYVVYETDIAELSLQAWLLREMGYMTSEKAYVVIHNRTTGRRQTKEVTLQGDLEVRGLLNRYFDLYYGRAVPRKRRDFRCKSCGWQKSCC